MYLGELNNGRGQPFYCCYVLFLNPGSMIAIHPN